MSQLFKPCRSIWKDIESHVCSEQKLLYIKAAIGDTLIEEIEDLHSEISLLSDIWKDQIRSDEKDDDKNKTLAESPRVREDLLKQIQLFAKLFEKVDKRGERYLKAILSDEEEKLIKEIKKNEKVDCLYESSSILHQTVDRFLQISNLNDYKTEESVSILRDYFEEERRFLLKHSEVIQNAIIEAKNVQPTARSQGDPTVAVLRRLSNKLERAALDINKKIPAQTGLNQNFCVSEPDITYCTRNTEPYCATHRNEPDLCQSPNQTSQRSTDIHSSFVPSPPAGTTALSYKHRRQHLISSKKLSVNVPVSLASFADLSKRTPLEKMTTKDSLA